MKTLSIGELAKRAEVGIETVRFYERQGLLEEPKRTGSGYRQYGEETVHALTFIRRAKELGFTLKEIKSLLELQSDESVSRSEVRQQAIEKIAEIDAKIVELQRIRTSLQSLIKKCHEDGTIAGCPILVAMHGVDQTEQT